MKKWMFFVAAGLSVFAACSNEDDLTTQPQPEDGSVTFELSAVNKLSNGISTRAPVYSQEASQHVTRVSIYAFQFASGSSSYLYYKTYTVTDWSDGTTFKNFAVPDGNKLPGGTYKFLAVGRDASDLFSITTPTSTTSYGDMLATITNTGQESEIFSGSAEATVTDQGARVSIEMIRKVAGILGYFKNVPQQLNNSTVRYLRLTVSNSNQQVNLTTGTGINTTPVSYNIINLDLSGQAVSDGVFTGNDLSSQGVVKVANSQLGGAFYMPVSGVNMTLGLYDTTGTAIKEWTVKDNTNNATTFDILANHFYSLGTKGVAGSTNGGTPGDTGDDDNPIDLLIDQNIVITISPAWSLIHNLVIQ